MFYLYIYDVMGNEREEVISDFDLMETVKAYRIITICFDEAHHLKSE